MTSPDFEALSAAEKKKRFHQEHGPECHRAPDGTTLYYADGAVMEEGQTLDLTIFHFPPTPDSEEREYTLRWRQLMFARLKLAAAVRAFDQLNERLAHTLPGDENAELANLQQLQARVKEAKRLLKESETALTNTAKGRADAERRKTREEETRRIDEWQARRRAIRI